MTLAIYRGARRYVVRPYRGDDVRLWALLGPAYTRETARVLADSLTADLEPRRRRARIPQPLPIPVEHTGHVQTGG